MGCHRKFQYLSTHIALFGLVTIKKACSIGLRSKLRWNWLCFMNLLSESGSIYIYSCEKQLFERLRKFLFWDFFKPFESIIIHSRKKSKTARKFWVSFWINCWISQTYQNFTKILDLIDDSIEFGRFDIFHESHPLTLFVFAFHCSSWVTLACGARETMLVISARTKRAFFGTFAGNFHCYTLHETTGY